MHISFRNQEFKGSPAFVIHNAFSKQVCEKIIETYKDKTQKAKHQEGDKIISSGQKDSPRESEICWVHDNNIYQQTLSLMKIANHVSGWDFKITGQEDIQFTKYESEGKYDWHIDGWSDRYCARSFTFDTPKNLNETSSPTLINTTRKISCSVLLNDDFSGGEFDTAYLDVGPLEIKKQEIKPKQGDMIVFPSYLAHRVRPVRVGTRYSLVLWFAGPPLK